MVERKALIKSKEQKKKVKSNITTENTEEPINRLPSP